MINLLLVGSNGRMGEEVLRCAGDNFRILGLDIKGKNLSFCKFTDVDCKVDVVLDFSGYSAIDDVVKFCYEHKVPLVSAVTGYTKEQKHKLIELAKSVAVVHSNNFSFGICIMKKAVSLLTEMLSSWDIEIMETHHRNKADCPSGTCLSIVEEIEKVRDVDCVYRDNKPLKRKANHVGISVVRGGTVAGEHSVLFMGDGERLEIKHVAENRRIFALGALRVCEKIIGYANGMYKVEDFI